MIERRCILAAVLLALGAGLLVVNSALGWVTQPHNVMADLDCNCKRVTLLVRVPEGEEAEALVLTIWRSPPSDTIDEWEPRHYSKWTLYPGDRGPWAKSYTLSSGGWVVRLDRWLDGEWKKVHEEGLRVIR